MKRGGVRPVFVALLYLLLPRKTKDHPEKHVCNNEIRNPPGGGLAVCFKFGYYTATLLFLQGFPDKKLMAFPDICHNVPV